MQEPAHLLNSALKNEADTLLAEKGLHTILNRYGKPHLSGSYMLDLMTWRDLDVYLEVDRLQDVDIFGLASQIHQTLSPAKMSFRDERITHTPGLPNGLYWGVYLGDERAGAWKIDIWIVEPDECSRLLDYCHNIRRKLTPQSKLHILEIKSECWRDPRYRKSYASRDIYEAVLDKGLTTIEDFRGHLKRL